MQPENKLIPSYDYFKPFTIWAPHAKCNLSIVALCVKLPSFHINVPCLKRASVMILELQWDQTKANQSLSHTHTHTHTHTGVYHQTRVNNHMSHEDAKAECHTSAGATPTGGVAGENSSDRGSDGVRALVSEGLSKQWHLEGLISTRCIIEKMERESLWD